MKLGRREFVAGVAGAGAGVAAGRFSHLFPLSSPTVGPAWRPQDETTVASTCMLCPSRCGIVGRVVDGALVRIDGNPLHPVSRGGLCPKGRAGLQLLYHPARLTGPLERTGRGGAGDFRPIPWDDALARITERLEAVRDSGRGDRVGWLVGHVTGLMDDLLVRFAAALGGATILREDYRDGAERVLELSQGVAAPPAFDLERADVVLSFGAALDESWWCLPQSARARAPESGRRPRFVQADIRLSRTAAAADAWLPIKPGTFGALALGIAYVMLKEGLYDESWIRSSVRGFDDHTDAEGRRVEGFRTLILRHGRTEEIAALTGLPFERIIETAKTFGRARRPLALWDHAVGWRRGGLADAMAIHALNILAGSIKRPGGVFIQPASTIPPLDSPTGAGPRRASLEHAGPSSAGGLGDRRGDAALDALFIYGANPVASSPRPDEIRQALSESSFVVSFSPFLDETARQADLVLPDHVYLERWQDAPAPPTVPYPAWGVVQPMIRPLHDTRATGDLLLDVASRLGGDVKAACPWSSMEQMVRETGRSLAGLRRGSAFAPAFRRQELRELEARGWWLPHGLDEDRFLSSVLDSGGWFDPFVDDQGRGGASRLPDGKIELFPSRERERIAAAIPGLAEGFLPVPEAMPAAGAPSSAEYPLRLVPYRVMTLSSGATTLMPWLLERLGLLTGTAWQSWIEVNPQTADDLGLGSGERVRVVSRHGSYVTRLVHHSGAQPGVVNAPYGLHASVSGWGEIETANPLAAVGAERDPLTGLPDWYSTDVRLEPA